MCTTISIIGDGAMATLCGLILCEKGCAVRMWSAFPDYARQMRRERQNARYFPGFALPADLHIIDDDAQAFAGAELAISAVPTQFVRRVWQRLRPHCPRGLPICSTTKGIENETLLRPSQILLDVLAGGPAGDWPVVALSGPSIAPDVARKLPATVVAASSAVELAQRVQHLLSTPYFRIYTNNDIVGVELAGASKNVIAIAAGILDGLRAGDNAKAALLTRGLVEITRLGVAVGGRRETFAGLAGLGDLVTTCVSPIGRNRSFGQMIGEGRSVDDALAGISGVVEGMATTRSVLALADRHGVDMPITQAVHDVVFGGRSPRLAIENLMSRPPKREE